MEISDEAYLKAALEIFSQIRTGLTFPEGKGPEEEKGVRVADGYAAYVAIIANRLKADLETE